MYLNKFAERLHELILEKNYLIRDLSRLANIGKSTIYHYLQGNRIPTLSNILRLACFFKCNLDFLLGQSDEYYIIETAYVPNYFYNINEILKLCKISYYKLSKELSISVENFNSWRCHKTNPSVDSLIKIASYLDCSIDFLIGRES